MAFEKKIGIQVYKSCQRIQILFFIRKEFRMDRAVDVLTEKNEFTVNACSKRERTRGVARAVNGCHGAVYRRQVSILGPAI